METSVDCLLIVAAQDPALKTYAEIDGTLLVNQEGEFWGKTIDGELDVVRNIVGACLNTSQGVRVKITIDGDDVSDSVVGNITIAHNLNYISTFDFQLGDPKYSPLTYAHIAVDDEVVITVYINRQEIKMFTGLVDRTYTSHTESGFVLNVSGRDYGKKLLNKTMTLIAVQDAAQKSYRGSMVKYLAEQAGITNVDVPIGDRVTIDHSFQDQSIWNMIQKECAIEGWYIRFDENGAMKVKTRTIKTNVTNYPKVEWNYGEDKFDRIGLETSDRGIINKVTILGAIFEEEVVTINENEVEDEDWEPEPDVEVNVEKTFVDNEIVEVWSHTETVYVANDCKITCKYTGSTTPEGYIFPHYLNYRFEISGLGTIKSTTWTVTGGAQITAQGKTYCNIQRERSDEITGWPPTFLEQEFTIDISIKVGPLIGSHAEWITDEYTEETVTSEIVRTQIKATVSDPASIAIYGERKPNNEGTLQFPLAETEEQCKRIGENLILDSHRFIEQPDLEANLNPLLIVGHYIELDDKKLGYSASRYLIEEAIHTIDIDPETGAVTVRTRKGCVIYA